MGWPETYFFNDESWTRHASGKMHQNGIFEVGLNVLSGPGLWFSIPLLVFPKFLEWSYKIWWILPKFLHFLSLSSKCGIVLCANVQKEISFDSLEHVKCDASWRGLIAQLQWTRWAKNWFKTPKKGNWKSSENLPDCWKRMAYSDSVAQIDYT